ncbi:MAG: hypothetical protein JNK04_18965, partial [Myxococcales bacterium]|nr:hypothetical protein [Myxococcales bacterium]
VGIDKTLDFLSRPDRYTPGRPFLDDIFLIPIDPDPPEVPDAARRARTGWSGGLGQMAVDVFKGAMGITNLPGFLEFIISKVSTVCAEFLRAVYCRLLTLKETDSVSEAEILEAARRHLVGNIIETILSGLDFVNGLRKITLDIPIAEVAISTDALIGRAKEFASVKLEEYIDPVIKFAMRDLYGMIFAYRHTAITNKALTMEVHLAQLPTVFARMFRNVFFPLWDMVLERTIEAVSASLAPRVLEVGKQLLKARAQVEEVRGKIVQGLAALDTLPAALPDAAFSFKDPKGSVKKLKNDWNPIIKNAKKAWDDAEIDVTQDLPGIEGDPLETSFPLAQRIAQAEVAAVTAEHLKKVAPTLKWKRKKAALTTGETPAADAKKPADTHNTQGGGQLPAATPFSQPYPSNGGEEHYPFGDYPLSSPGNMMYAQASQPGGYAPYSQSYGGLPHGMPQHGDYDYAQANAELSGPFADISTADLPPPAADSSETTQQFKVSPELAQYAQLDDVEMTVDIDHVTGSGLPAFLNPSKKA